MDVMLLVRSVHESSPASSLSSCATAALHCQYYRRKSANSMVRFAGLPSTQITSCLVAAAAAHHASARINFGNNEIFAASSFATNSNFINQPVIKQISRGHGAEYYRRQRKQLQAGFIVAAEASCTSTMIKPAADRDSCESYLIHESTDLKSLRSLMSTPVQLLSDRWRDIQGAHNWEGLLEPIDPHLKGELIRYGEFAQVCYDVFDFEKHSKYCGSCKYNRRKVLESAGLKCAAADYEVTKYLYSTSDINLPRFFHKSSASPGETWSRDSNWIGFVAVATSPSEIQRLGRREIVVAWRGTVTMPEWICNLEDWLIPAAFHPREPRLDDDDDELQLYCYRDVKVEKGFRSIYTSKNERSRYNKESAQEQLLSEIRRLLKKYQGEEVSITVTGHSLGGALALLSAYDIAESEINLRHYSSSSHIHSCRRSVVDSSSTSDVPITVITFAGPRVGNDAFRERCEELGIKTLRVVNEKDVVPNVPGVVLNENMHVLRRWIDKLPWTYSHVGAELTLNTQDSPYLQWEFLDFGGHHNLEAYLHLLDGYHSTQKRFSSLGDRDLALVNKFSQLLKPENGIPSFWWQQENKGLQKNEEGRWVQCDREEEDIPIVYRDA